MAISYKKLWKLLIDKDMRKEDLRLKAGISTNTIAKLGKNENVNTGILVKICAGSIVISRISWRSWRQNNGERTSIYFIQY